MQMLHLKFQENISTSFGTFDNLKYSLQGVKIGQNQNFESRKTDQKKYFHVHFDKYFQRINPFVEKC